MDQRHLFLNAIDKIKPNLENLEVVYLLGAELFETLGGRCISYGGGVRGWLVLFDP